MRKIKFTLLTVCMLLLSAMYTSAQYLSEGFEGGAMPAGWTQETVSGATSWVYRNGAEGDPTSAQSGSFNACFYSENKGDAARLVTPAINLGSSVNPQLTFWHAQKNWGGDQDELRVYYKTTAGGAWTILPGATWTSDIPDWQLETISLPSASATYYLAFEATADYGFGAVIDNIAIGEPITCSAPSAGYVSSVTSTSAVLHWVESGSATLWNLEYGPKGFTPTGTPSKSGVTNPYTYGGLTQSSSYDFYVQADCGGGDKSYWSGPYSFNTLCDPQTVTTSWTEDFENGGSIPMCWTNEANNTIDWTFKHADIYQGDHTNGDGYYAFFEVWATNASAGDVGQLTSGTLNISGMSNPQLKFYWQRGNNTDIWSNNAPLEVDIYANGAWHNDVAPGLIMPATDNWQETTVYLSNYKYNDVRVRFRVYLEDDSEHNFILDDVTINEGPTCPPPSQLAVGSVTNNTAVFSWSESGSATTWNVQYGASGFTLGAGTTVTASSNPHTLTGLTPATTYQYYVQSKCSVSDLSTWVGPISFTTECNASIIFPNNEDFENSGNIPSCWTNEVSNDYDWTFENYHNEGSFIADGHGDVSNGNQYFAVFDTKAAGADAVGSLITVPFDLTSTTNPALKFWWNCDYTYDLAALEFQVDIFAFGTWHNDVLPDIDATQEKTNAAWKQEVISLFDYQGSNFVQVRFKVISNDTYNSSIGLDDVMIDANAPLMTATDITAFSIPEQSSAAVIDAVNHTVNIEVAYDAISNWFTPNFSLSPGASAKVAGVIQVSGQTTNDYTSAVVYTVTAQNPSFTQDWTVTVTRAAASSAKDFVSYQFAEQTAPATINAANGTININVNSNANLASLVATYSLSTNAVATIGGVPQVSGVSTNNFTTPVSYIVMAEDLSLKTWTVTVTKSNGIDDLKATAGITVFPNPFNDKVTINIEQPAGMNNAVVEIKDVLGRVKYTTTVPSHATSLTIPLSELSKGIYVITIDNGVSRYNEKLIKQ